MKKLALIIFTVTMSMSTYAVSRFPLKSEIPSDFKQRVIIHLENSCQSDRQEQLHEEDTLITHFVGGAHVEEDIVWYSSRFVDEYNKVFAEVEFRIDYSDLAYGDLLRNGEIIIENINCFN